MTRTAALPAGGPPKGIPRMAASPSARCGFPRQNTGAGPAAAGSCGCAWHPAEGDGSHHARLLAVDHDPDALLDLLELAVTWAELDYSALTVVPPHDWIAFAAAHDWRDPHRALRIVSLATDVAQRSSPTTAHGHETQRAPGTTTEESIGLLLDQIAARTDTSRGAGSP